MVPGRKIIKERKVPREGNVHIREHDQGRCSGVVTSKLRPEEHEGYGHGRS